MEKQCKKYCWCGDAQGGTVFHDEGNLNYSFIVPNDSTFTRNKHAQMVVDAIRGIVPDKRVQGKELRPLNLIEDIRVNDRHDIVISTRPERGSEPMDKGQTVKVSGSAYKLIRGRVLHHGTLLFSSPNLKSIGSYLRSPARGFIDAKGVESVRSPIGNLTYSDNSTARDVMKEKLERGIAEVFEHTYKDGNTSYSTVGEYDIVDHAAIGSGINELRSQEWKLLQTPAFTFTNLQLPEEIFKPAPQPTSLPVSTKVVLRARHGTITECHISLSDNSDDADAEAQQVGTFLKNKRLHEITNWGQVFAGKDRWTHPSTGALISWLSEMFPPLSS